MNETKNRVWVNGRWWYRYAVEHTDTEGLRYEFPIFAISDDHAACIVDDIRRTARLVDRFATGDNDA